MGDALLGFLGVIVGAVAALFGTLHATKAERKRVEEERQRRVRTAARAWREDFYAFQAALAQRLSDSATTLNPPAALATDEQLLVLADRFKGYGAWTRVTSTRRQISLARGNYSHMTSGEIAELFVDIEKGRRAVSSVDSDWPFKPHPKFAMVLPHVPTGKVVEDPAGT